MILLTHSEIIALIRVVPPFVEAMRDQGFKPSSEIVSINEKLLSYARAAGEAEAMAQASNSRNQPA